MSTNILLIEDELELADNIKNLLEEYGFSVFMASNGKEGLELVKKITPDLIICDIMMPGINGYQVKQELNKNGNTSLIPFIYLTGRVERHDVRRGMDLGADDFLPKPFRSNELIVSINTRLKKSEIIKAKFTSPENNTESKNKFSERDSILVSINNEPTFIKVDRIKYIIAERQYSNVKLNNNKSIILRKALNDWERILPEKMFIRIHRKTIVNINQINYIARKKQYGLKVIMKDASVEFEISRRYAQKIRGIFSLK